MVGGYTEKDMDQPEIEVFETNFKLIFRTTGCSEQEMQPSLE